MTSTFYSIKVSLQGFMFIKPEATIGIPTLFPSYPSTPFLGHFPPLCVAKYAPFPYKNTGTIIYPGRGPISCHQAHGLQSERGREREREGERESEDERKTKKN